MISLLLRWLINAVALLLVATLGIGIRVEGFWAALVAAAVLGVVNAVLRPLLLLLSLPVNLLTLGLFTLVINGVLLLLTAAVVKGFYVDGLLSAVFGSIILGLLSTVLAWLVHV